MSFEKIIKDYLVGRAGSDAVFAEKFYDRMDKEGDKAIDGCCSYIKNQARKEAQSGCAVIEDAKVFGWAMHYFDENLSAPTTAPAAKVSTTADPDVMRVTAEKAVKTPVAKPKAKKEDECQLSLW
jgi:hypothetical protein